MLFPNSPNCMHWLSAVFLYTDYNSIKLGETETVLRANMKPLLPFRKKKKKEEEEVEEEEQEKKILFRVKETGYS